jgi:hypothetical protein
LVDRCYEFASVADDGDEDETDEAAAYAQLEDGGVDAVYEAV